MKFVLLFVLFIAFVYAQNKKIVGGATTTTGKYPYQVAIVAQSGDSYQIFCGGSILSANYVLTAAHCFRELETNSNQDKSLNGLYVASTTFISGVNNNNRYAIQQAFIHPSYTFSVNGPNQVDICVLRVSTIRFGENTRPIALARISDRSLYAPGVTSYVSGFGLTSGVQSDNNRQTSNQLMVVDIPVVTAQACNNALSNSGLDVNFNIVCSGADGKDSCQGDSGGPLSVISDGYYMQIGVVVFGTVNSNNPIQCGAAGNYGVYTEVAAYRTSFIEPITGALPNVGNSNTATSNGTGDGSTSASSIISFSPLYIMLLALFALFFSFI